jgi:multidrug efflux pump subunit AcrB
LLGTGTGIEIRRPLGYSIVGGLMLNEAPSAGASAK